MKITLTGDPVSDNKRLMLSRGRFIAGSEYKACKLAWQREVSAQWRFEPMEGDVGLDITVYFPNNRKDVSNTLKCILDSVEKVLYNNDRQITELTVHKRFDKQNPRVEIII